MKRSFWDYDTYIFDCDGVLLDSNFIKAEAFYEVVKDYGEAYAFEFKKYHEENGGVSRFEKFAYFRDYIAKDSQINIDTLLENFASILSKDMRRDIVTQGSVEVLIELKRRRKKCFVVSASEQNELQKLLCHHDLLKYFLGVFGSPKSKIENVQEYIYSMENESVLFIGDSALDYEVATHFGFSFLFVSGFTSAHIDRVDYNCLLLCDLLSDCTS